MPSYRAVSRNEFGHLRWKRFERYDFAASDVVAPLVVQELGKACTALPVGFIQQGEGFVPAALLGLKPGQNLFVTAEGQWIGPYTPAAYRGHPFALAKGQGDQLVLCVDTDSGLVGEETGERFFDDAGEPAQSVRDVLNFLEQVHRNELLTQRLCGALQAEGLIVPWPLTVKGDHGEVPMHGLYRIDEEKLRGLEGEALARVHAAGALPVAYCQLISMQHIQMLGKLTDAHAKRAQAVDPDLESFFEESSDGLKFDFH